MIKNPHVCNYCAHKHVPTNFVPCLGCKQGNMDHLIQDSQQAKEKSVECEKSS